MELDPELKDISEAFIRQLLPDHNLEALCAPDALTELLPAPGAPGLRPTFYLFCANINPVGESFGIPAFESTIVMLPFDCAVPDWNDHTKRHTLLWNAGFMAAERHLKVVAAALLTEAWMTPFRVPPPADWAPLRVTPTMLDGTGKQEVVIYCIQTIDGRKRARIATIDRAGDTEDAPIRRFGAWKKDERIGGGQTPILDAFYAGFAANSRARLGLGDTPNA